MASRSEENADERSNGGFIPGQNLVKPEIPRFEDHYKAQAEGVHPFDRVVNTYDETDIRGDDESLAEEERERALYHRELMGKLIGHRLTPGEYEILCAGVRQNRSLDGNNEEFLEARHRARLMQEYVEKVRRQKVITGEWSEAESAQKLSNWISDKTDEYQNGPCRKQFERDFVQFMARMR